MPLDQRAAILGSIIEESGGNPYAKNTSGAYQGLLQWGADRYRPLSRDPETELNNQVQYIKESINNSTDGKSWTHGGKGSGYNSKDETYNTFHDEEAPFDKKFRAFSYGYVRPQGKEDSYQNRLKVGKKVLNKLVVDEVLSKPEPSKVPRYDFDSYVFKPKNKYSEGGYMSNLWDSLSMKEKSEMMRVAIANGITSLPEIRQAYNKFAKGGRMNTSTWKANEFAEGGQKDSYIDADDRRHKILLETREGNLYDSNGNNYTQSYLDESNVPIITGTMPRDTSSYYDPNTTLEFINAATAPISNFSPSNIVGSIRKAEDYPAFMNSFMNQNNAGFFTDNFAKEHPIVTGIGNFAGDILVGDILVGGAITKGLSNVKGKNKYYKDILESYLKDGNIPSTDLDESYEYFLNLNSATL